MTSLDKGFKYAFFPKAIGIDVYGDPKSAQVVLPDPENSTKFYKLIKEYVKWQETNHGFYEGYKWDKRINSIHFYCQYLYSAIGMHSFNSYL